MTEEEWLRSNDPLAMCAQALAETTWKTRWIGWMKARRFRISDRKIRLVELACCERTASLLQDPRLHNLLPLARKHAEGQLGVFELTSAIDRSMNWLTDLEEHRILLPPSRYEALRCAATALGRFFHVSPPGDGAIFLLTARAHGADLRARERQIQADLVREILGNPFRLEPIDPTWLSANDQAARRLVEEIDETERYGELPILADALEDAGCTSAAILSHCRSDGPHVPGCWVMDALLGRE
jgi:hypothetical protein